MKRTTTKNDTPQMHEAFVQELRAPMIQYEERQKSATAEKNRKAAARSELEAELERRFDEIFGT